MMNKDLREDVAAVLMDFAAVLTEEIAASVAFRKQHAHVGWKWEAAVMERISPLISRLREGKSLEPSEAHKRHD